AEDGIRGFHVTGVQTCALPIWDLLSAPLAAGSAAHDRPPRTPRSASGSSERTIGCRQRRARSSDAHAAERVGIFERGALNKARKIGRASCRERGTCWEGAGAER